MTIVDAQIPMRAAGLSFRRTRVGPEQQLVDWFLDQTLLSLRAGERLTIFREPRLPSGFPDLVLVVWKDSVASKWTSSRRDLTPRDLQVMHYLVSSGPSAISDLELLFRTPVRASVERLLVAKMIRRVQGRWQARSLASTFAAQRILAIEAKVHDWRVALDQAFLNTWFAAESYILIPHVPRNGTLITAAIERGIGVLSKEPTRGELTLRPERSPRSYVSWLLNDWAWLAA